MPNKEKPLLQKETITLLFLALLVGILHHYMVYGHTIGLSYPLFTVMFYAVILLGLRKGMNRGLDIEFMLLVPIFLFSIIFLLFANSFLQLLNFMVIPVLIVAQTMRMAEIKRREWYSLHYVADLLQTSLFPRI